MYDPNNYEVYMVPNNNQNSSLTLPNANHIASSPHPESSESTTSSNANTTSSSTNDFSTEGIKKPAQQLNPQQAKVVAVGPGKTLDDGKKSPIDVKEGDTVLFAKYSGTEVKIDGVEYLVIAEKDILAVVE